MKRTIIALFLIVAGSSAIFAQKDFGYYPKERGGKYVDSIELQCYNSTNSFAEFKNCIETFRLPICPKNWETDSVKTLRVFPCRNERKEDYWDKQRRIPLIKEDKDRIEKLVSRQLPNEKPETFDQY